MIFDLGRSDTGRAMRQAEEMLLEQSVELQTIQEAVIGSVAPQEFQWAWLVWLAVAQKPGEEAKLEGRQESHPVTVSVFQVLLDLRQRPCRPLRDPSFQIAPRPYPQHGFLALRPLPVVQQPFSNSLPIYQVPRWWREEHLQRGQTFPDE